MDSFDLKTNRNNIKRANRLSTIKRGFQLSKYCSCLRGIKGNSLLSRHDLKEDEDGYSSGESDCGFETPYSELGPEDKELRMKYLWHQAFIKGKGA